MSTQRTLKHIVLFAFTPETTDDQIRMIERAFLELRTTITAISDLEWGKVINQPELYTHCLLVIFGHEDDLHDYANHPAHQAIADTYGHLAQQVLVLDYWTSVL